MARLRQKGRRSSNRSRLSAAPAPNHNGGGELKISLRPWVAKTNVKKKGAISGTAPTSTAVQASVAGLRSARSILAGAMGAYRKGLAAEEPAVHPGQQRDHEEEQPRDRRRGAEVAVRESRPVHEDRGGHDRMRDPLLDVDQDERLFEELQVADDGQRHREIDHRPQQRQRHIAELLPGAGAVQGL